MQTGYIPVKCPACNVEAKPGLFEGWDTHDGGAFSFIACDACKKDYVVRTNADGTTRDWSELRMLT